jgi:glutathione S-transferase
MLQRNNWRQYRAAVSSLQQVIFPLSLIRFRLFLRLFSFFRAMPVYQLYIANKNYSSWSLRPWVLLRQLGIEFEECLNAFESGDNFEKFRKFSPSGTVPCLVDGDAVVWDSLAIAEYLAEKEAGIWPDNANARAFARCASAEMHSSFSSLRNICPMNCAITVELSNLNVGLKRDVSRIDELWQEGLSRFGGGFLAGEKFTAVDAFFCPVAYRVQSYQLAMSSESLAYCQRLLSLPAMKEWDVAAIKELWREEAHEEEAAAAGRIVADRRG